MSGHLGRSLARMHQADATRRKREIGIGSRVRVDHVSEDVPGAFHPPLKRTLSVAAIHPGSDGRRWACIYDPAVAFTERKYWTLSVDALRKLPD